VTGGSGFLGSRLVRRLLDQGQSVRVLDLSVLPDFREFTVQGNICAPADCDKALEGVSVVYHLAALYRDDVRPRGRYYEVNYEGTRVLLEHMRRHGVSKLVFVSSFSVYGLENTLSGEDSVLTPVNDYGRSKVLAEQAVREWTQEVGSSACVIIRPSVIFGEGSRGNVFTLMERIASGKFAMVGSGQNCKSMSYVENVAAFCQFAAGLEGGQIHVFNYADKPDMKVREIVDCLSSELKLTVRQVPLPKSMAMAIGHLGDFVRYVTKSNVVLTSDRIRKFFADTSLITTRLEASGFTRPFDMRRSLATTVRYEFPNLAPGKR
jgi:nucleoside-diphosphate-sugar epimerase